jgi:hypothetical protein
MDEALPPSSSRDTQAASMKYDGFFEDTNWIEGQYKIAEKR